MASRFRGEQTCKVDAKGRFSLPTQFRRVIQSGDPNFGPETKAELVLVYGDETFDHMRVYPIDAMEELEAKIDRLPSSDNKRRMQRLFTGFAQQMEMDGDGRLLLSPKLRAKLGLDADVFVIADGKMFQIWHPDVFNEKFGRKDEAEPLAGPDELSDFLDATLSDLDI